MHSRPRINLYKSSWPVVAPLIGRRLTPLPLSSLPSPRTAPPAATSAISR